MEQVDPSILRIGPWTIEARARRISSPAGSVRIEPKAMGVLLELTARPGEVVDRRDLVASVWGEEMATDDVLSRAISELRRALGDDPRQPRFVETVRGSGYRLLVPDDVDVPRASVAAASASVVDGSAYPSATDLPAPRSPRVSRRLALAGLGGVVVVGLTTVVVRAGMMSEPAPSDFQVVPLTTRPGEESAPKLSPDGTRIAYSWLDEQQRTQHNYVMLVAEPSELEVTTGMGQHHLSAWSPDGTRLAVTKLDRGQWGLHVVPALGGGERLITRVPGAYILGLDWSPNGMDLVYAAQDSSRAPFDIRIMDLESQRERRLTDGGNAAFGDVYSTFSPDGQTVAFVRFYTEVAADVYVVPVSGGSVRRLTTDERSIGGIAFSSDGRSVLYSANRDGRSAVWRVAFDGRGAPAKVYESARGITGLTAFRSGQDLVVAEGDRDLNLWRVGLGGEQAPERVVASTRSDALPRHSPDGVRIAFVSDRSGQSELWLARADGADEVRLTSEGGARGAPAWSPNGDRIAFERQAGSRSEVWVADVASRTSRPVAMPMSDALAPSWSRDGRSLYVSSRRSGRWEIYRVPANGGQAQPVTTSGGMGGRETVSGTAILYARPYERGLWRLDLRTQQETLVTPDLAAGDCTNWDVVSHGVYFVRRGEDGRQELWFRSFDSSDARMIVRGIRVPVGTGGISVAPDGASVVYAQIDRRDGDLSLITNRVIPSAARNRDRPD